MTAADQATAPAATLDLKGLEADNLLAFLALLGLLRALDVARPEWQARVAWRGVPPVAVLELAEPATPNEVASAVYNAVSLLASAYDFDGRKKVDFSVEEFGRAVREAARVQDARIARDRLSLLAALGSSGPPLPKQTGLSFYRSAMVLADGDSQNFFLARIQTLIDFGKVESEFVEFIRNALFDRWTRQTDAKSGALRWDPVEARPYAYRARAPNDDSLDPPRTELGANILAAIGLAALTVAPTSRGVMTIGMDGRGEGATFTWPLWDKAISYPAVCALLRRPELVFQTPEPSKLAHLGVFMLMRAQVVSIARLNVFSRAHPV